MNVLAASLGPGSPGLEINGISNGNQNLYFTRFVNHPKLKHFWWSKRTLFYFSAFFAAALTLNHVAWTVIAGVAIELGNSNRSKGLIAFILIAHFLCTGTSLLNNTGNNLFIGLRLEWPPKFNPFWIRSCLACNGDHVVISIWKWTSCNERKWLQGNSWLTFSLAPPLITECLWSYCSICT